MSKLNNTCIYCTAHISSCSCNPSFADHVAMHISNPIPFNNAHFPIKPLNINSPYTLPPRGWPSIDDIHERSDKFKALMKQSKTKQITTQPINQLDLLYLKLFSKLLKYSDDVDLNNYFAFDVDHIRTIYAGGAYNNGHYAAGGVHTFCNVSGHVIISTPLLRFIIHDGILDIEGIDVHNEITKDIIVNGLIPILQFIRSLYCNDSIEVAEPTSKIKVKRN